MKSDTAKHLDKLNALFDRQRELGVELRHSIELQGLWADVFKHGRAWSHAEGSKWAGFELVVRDGKGQVRRFPMERVPLCLWPEHLKHSRAGNHDYERLRASRGAS